MDALVTEIAVAVFPGPVPFVMDGAVGGAVALRRAIGSRAAPEVVVHRARGLLRAGDIADGVSAFVAQPARDLHRAELACPDIFDRFADARLRADLRPGLADLVVMPRRLDNASAFPDVMADRFLDIDMLARLHRPDGGEGVPMVRRRDADRVNRLVVHDAAQILHDAWFGALPLHRRIDRRADDAGVNVADCGDHA